MLLRGRFRPPGIAFVAKKRYNHYIYDYTIQEAADSPTHNGTERFDTSLTTYQKG